MKKENDVRTMEVIKDIANDVESMIQFTADVPSSYSDKMFLCWTQKYG